MTWVDEAIALFNEGALTPLDRAEVHGLIDAIETHPALRTAIERLDREKQRRFLRCIAVGVVGKPEAGSH